MGKVKDFLDDWMLPLAMAAGITLCLLLHFVPSLSSGAEGAFSRFAKDAQPALVALMLFLQFNKISPHDLRFRRWHLYLLVFQGVMSSM